ncbi:hypothetical protein AM500_19915 [Bacillus sp. FJAT-18017]|uniref:DUF3231 family protein n=1 Tax=Bacillus sp. FJAT-18017 TaxID=1705566 RepID=UPI0006AED4CB|nr:DUF3231 family protein [Bacillus sp. FJAT-18017]ALC91797.1 hypothetical protein AM500_19915 [Bacillus sp. FJAT-18017]
MEDHHSHVKLTSAELAYLWTTYLSDGMSVCMLKHFLKHVEDEAIQSVAAHALKLSEQHIDFIETLFAGENIQIPVGYTDSDVNLNAAPLFSNSFYLNYIRNMSKGGLVTYGRILQNVYREDIRAFYNECLTDTIELDTSAVSLLLKKGLAVRPPSIPYPDQIQFVHKQSFILEGLGRRETLTGTEVTNLYANINSNHFGSCLATAFAQVAQSDKVRDYLLRGKEIALKHINVLGSYLKMASLPVPMSYDHEVTKSTDVTFSDKLLMFHFNLMIYAGIGNYGLSISETQRSDLINDYSRLTAEILKFSEDGANIMIANQWLEQPPLSANRRDLAKE